MGKVAESVTSITDPGGFIGGLTGADSADAAR